MSRAAIVGALVLALTGCATQAPRGPILDMQGVDPASLSADVRECQAYADQVDVADSAVSSGLVGALVGGLIGAAIGGRDGAALGAKVFGVDAAAQGAAGAVRDRRTVMRECLRGRGYRVLL